MAIKINRSLNAKKLVPKLERFFDLSGQKILSIEKSWRASKGTPVFTEKGKYTMRGWTEWTQGFQFGSAVLQYDAWFSLVVHTMTTAQPLSGPRGHRATAQERRLELLKSFQRNF